MISVGVVIKDKGYSKNGGKDALKGRVDTGIENVEVSKGIFKIVYDDVLKKRGEGEKEKRDLKKRKAKDLSLRGCFVYFLVR